MLSRLNRLLSPSPLPPKPHRFIQLPLLLLVVVINTLTGILLTVACMAIVPKLSLFALHRQCRGGARSFTLPSMLPNSPVLFAPSDTDELEQLSPR